MLSYAPPAVGEKVVLDTFQRTASEEVRALVGSLREKYDADRNRSRIRDLLDKLDSLGYLLNGMYLVPDDWNGYGSPKPSAGSIEASRGILNGLWSEIMLPDKVLPSADGGVSLVFLSDSDNRAVIETLNEDETYVLLYDRQGNSKTLAWGETSLERHEALRQLHAHLQGVRLATA